MNFGAIVKGIGYLIQYFVAPTPQMVAVKSFAGEAWPFLQYVAAYPRARQLENSATALAASFGAMVHLDPATGHVITIDPPKDAPAPAYQSPADFNNDPRNR